MAPGGFPGRPWGYLSVRRFLPVVQISERGYRPNQDTGQAVAPEGRDRSRNPCPFPATRVRIGMETAAQAGGGAISATFGGCRWTFQLAFRQFLSFKHLDAMTKQGKPSVESSKLWQRGFGDEGTDENVSRLVTSLRVIRRNVEVLTSRIAVSLPELTIHDISHLDALWEVADTVAGSDFPLNPIEAYVFGAAVLLHDTGLCFEVYSGGRDALRETLEWRDAYGRLSRTPSDTENLEKEADFEALRALHASKAARLAIKPWRGDEEELYLIDDRELRENYGQLIGDLASSHHWNLEMVVSRFATSRPPAAFFDADWVVDSLKVACMLRVCAKINRHLI